MTQWLAVIINTESGSGEPTSTFDQWSADWQVVAFSVLGLVVAMLILMWVYTSMQHPRLYLTRDRNDRPGVKFKDSELVGFPIRIGIGERSLAKGEVEIKPRVGALMSVKAEEAVGKVLEMIQANPILGLPAGEEVRK